MYAHAHNGVETLSPNKLMSSMNPTVSFVSLVSHVSVVSIPIEIE